MHCMHQVIDEQTIDDLIKKIDGIMGAIQQFNISDHASDVSGQADLMHVGSGGIHGRGAYMGEKRGFVPQTCVSMMAGKRGRSCCDSHQQEDEGTGHEGRGDIYRGREGERRGVEGRGCVTTIP